ncbi:MAG: hypothetical protein IPK82_11255 [Polyangiaceae bacterium]|nr:hypothetical protein [Polyangiaceae bacterium]
MGIDTSKGTEIFIYVGNKDLNVQVDSLDFKRRIDGKDPDPLTPNPIEHVRRELHMSDISWYEHTGRVSLGAWRGTVPLFARFAEVAPSTGNLGDNNVDNFLEASLDHGSRNDAHISWGFYNGSVDETHQLWLYINNKEEQWMERLFDAEPKLLKEPLSIMALPGSHDAGMFTGIDSDEAARNLVDSLISRFATKNALEMALVAAWALGPVTPAATALAGLLAGAIFALRGTSLARRALLNLAYTQKDDIYRQLRLGVRFFDFRPGYTVSGFRWDQQLRHQHGFVPGYELYQFIYAVVDFLNRCPKEIVVVNFKYSGFLDNDMKPPHSEVDGMVDSIVNRELAHVGIVRGGIDDLHTPIGDLLKQNKRLIVLWDSTNIAGSYSDDAYATVDSAKIVGALGNLIGAVSATDRVAVFELQGTRTATTAAQVRSALSFSNASNPLLSTKARFDRETYPYVLQNAPRVPKTALVVLLNDFVDCAMRDYAAAITRRRLGS